MSAQRMIKERQALQQKQLNNLYSGYIVQNQSDNVWKINVAGPQNTPFQGGQFVVKIKLDNFPFKAPVVNFATQIYHPNIDKQGNTCGQMLQIGQNWAPAKRLSGVMDKVKSLLVAPNLQRPINNQAAQDYKNGTWEKKAKQYTNKYAK